MSFLFVSWSIDKLSVGIFINQKSRRITVMTSELSSIGSGVGEGNIVQSQRATKQKVRSENEEKLSILLHIHNAIHYNSIVVWMAKINIALK